MEDVASNKRKMKELEDNLLYRLTSTQVWIASYYTLSLRLLPYVPRSMKKTKLVPLVIKSSKYLVWVATVTFIFVISCLPVAIRVVQNEFPVVSC